MCDLSLEKSLFLQGHQTIFGVDEAGRGPLAGPVVAACVALQTTCMPRGALRHVDDSKKLSKKTRIILYQEIMRTFQIGIGKCDHVEIDESNILQASLLAMRRSIEALPLIPDILLIDGKFGINALKTPQLPIVKGDIKHFVIAAASIVAKVTRDYIMDNMHLLYPQYGFGQHKGYPTKLHRANLAKYGPCPIHRRSFAPVKAIINE